MKGHREKTGSGGDGFGKALLDGLSEARAWKRGGLALETVIVITSEAEYQQALREIEELWNSEPGTPEGDGLNRLCNAVEAYEDIHWPIGNQ
ncbi:MAG: hypothetical protein WA975_03430 [Mesorhizobium sp.]